MGVFDTIFTGGVSGPGGFGSGDPANTDPSAAYGTGPFSQAGIGAGFGLLGLGIEAFGAFDQYEGAQKAAQASEQIAGLEGQVNEQRRLAMQITGRRQQMEIIRQGQRASAQATAAATNQGAQFGSGLAGGLAQVAGQAGSNLLGENQQLAVGNEIFNLDAKISQQRILQAQAQGQQATGQGISSIGGVLLKAAPILAGLALG
jgi:hypothetical protein